MPEDPDLWPARSDAVFVADFLGNGLAYDVVAQRAYVIDPTATRCLKRAPIAVEALIDEICSSTSEPRSEVEQSVRRAIAELTSIGLLGRQEPLLAPPGVTGSPVTDVSWTVGRAHGVLDKMVAFRSPDSELIEAIDSFLGPVGDTQPPDTFFDVEPTDDGSVRLLAAEEWTFPSLDALLAQLPVVLNDFAIRTNGCAVLHAGGVRLPTRGVVLLVGPEEYGKSTLTAALVKCGAQYLSDEMIGVQAGTRAALAFPKPIELDRASREVLNMIADGDPYAHPSELNPDCTMLCGPVGTIDEIILPKFVEGHEIEVERLTPHQAIRSVLPQVLNLFRAGEQGLQSICDLVSTVPVWGITHGSSMGVAEKLVDGCLHIPDGPPHRACT